LSCRPRATRAADDLNLAPRATPSASDDLNLAPRATPSASDEPPWTLFSCLSSTSQLWYSFLVMPAPLVDYKSSLWVLLEEIIHTIARLEANAFTGDLALPFVAMLDRWRQLLMQEVELLIEMYRADAKFEEADDFLDDFVDMLERLLFLMVDKNRKDPRYAFFFGKKPAHQIKRPLLGNQLIEMKTWIQALKTSKDKAPDPGPGAQGPKLPSLPEMGDQLDIYTKTGDEATDRRNAAYEQMRVFRELGERKAFVDDLNALRQSTFGKLGEIQHQHPEANLPSDFASRFFKHAPKKPAKEPTVEELEERKAELQKELEQLAPKIDAARAKELAAKEKQARREAKQAELAAAKKAAADQQKKIKEMEAALDKDEDQ
jgi:hypothetical protein